MTTPDLEALARELEERACALDKDARDWRKHNPPVGSFSDLRAGDREASAIAHRQAAALIRAKAPGREEIARLIWPVAFGKRTDGLTLDQVSDMQIDALTKADAILALFHLEGNGRRPMTLSTPSPALDPRDPDPSREGIFRNHNCWACQNGEKPCRQGSPSRCDNPHARND